jgi:hypothetical protein
VEALAGESRGGVDAVRRQKAGVDASRLAVRIFEY